MSTDALYLGNLPDFLRISDNLKYKATRSDYMRTMKRILKISVAMPTDATYKIISINVCTLIHKIYDLRLK